MAQAEVAEGVRRSGRDKSDNLKRANIKNDLIVSHALEKYGLEDVSSDYGEDGQESGGDEEANE